MSLEIDQDLVGLAVSEKEPGSPIPAASDPCLWLVLAVALYACRFVR
jgi:hypothetical protein